MPGATQDRAPAVELAIRSPVTRLQLFGTHADGPIDHVARVVQVPVVVEQAPGPLHTFVKRRARVRREDMECRGLDPLLHGPFDGTLEYVIVLAVHAEHEAGVDHHAEIVQPSG